MNDELISRKGALFALGERPISWTDSDYELGLQNQYDIDRARLEQLPAAQPKTGKWIYDGDCYICNKCGTAYSWWADSQTSNYCPNCGAMMKEGE